MELYTIYTHTEIIQEGFWPFVFVHNQNVRLSYVNIIKFLILYTDANTNNYEYEDGHFFSLFDGFRILFVYIYIRERPHQNKTRAIFVALIFEYVHNYVNIYLPSKKEIICIKFIQRGPTSSTLVRRCINDIQIFCAYWVVSIHLLARCLPPVNLAPSIPPAKPVTAYHSGR